MAIVRNLLAVTAVLGSLPACAQAPLPNQEGPSAETGLKIGRHEISTVPTPEGMIVRSATYTPSGKVLVSYAKQADAPERDITLATMNDDGTGLHVFFTGKIPERPKDNGLRYMVFPDNRRIFMGDFVIECTAPLEACTDARLLPVQYPAEIADGDHVGHRWSEPIMAPDNRHIAWTSLLANYAALVFTGELQRGGAGYVIVNSQIVSTLDPFRPDPAHADGVLPSPIRGGEVKQFVGGGTAISAVGAVRRDLPGSVVLDLPAGRNEAITDTPGYTETTIFSPDEKLGITMTTRFSAGSDLAVLGLLPRPYPDSLNMALSMFAYTYSVTGVRRERPGNVGPALIDIAASKSTAGYLGANLNTDPDWVYYSPMSWHPDGRRAMWMEGRRDGGTQRIQIVRLPDYRPGPSIPARRTPPKVSYGITDLSAVKAYAHSSRDIHVRVYGRTSGHIDYDRTPEKVEKVYTNFSDDGLNVFSGREVTLPNPRGNSTYMARIDLAGPRPGRMDLKLTFGPLGGSMPARIVFDQGADGQPLSQGYAEYAGQRQEVSKLNR